MRLALHALRDNLKGKIVPGCTNYLAIWQYWAQLFFSILLIEKKETGSQKDKKNRVHYTTRYDAAVNILYKCIKN